MKLFGTEHGAGCGAGKVVSKQLLQVAALVCGSLMIVAPATASEPLFITGVTASPPPSGAQRLCQQYSWACSNQSGVNFSSDQEYQIVKKINRKVNSSTRTITDQSQYKTQERWALPTKVGGDCEDFALLKKRDLIKAGIDPSKLLIATVLDTRRNAHAVLVYRSAKGDLVLDNLTSRIKPWSDTRYLFLRMQDPNQPRKWVGVFRKS